MRTKATTPVATAHVQVSPPKSATRGRAVELIAEAAYTNPQMTMYGAKYQTGQRPRERQPSKIVLPVATV
jgi:hypothetical protein